MSQLNLIPFDQADFTFNSAFTYTNNTTNNIIINGNLSGNTLMLYRFDGSIINITGFTSNNGSGSITGLTSSDITNALGYIPYNSTNPNSFINFISGDTRYYLNTNPNNYITSSFTENRYYKLTNPSNYISSITFDNIVTALGYIPLSSATSSNINTYSGLTVSGDVTGSTLTNNLILRLLDTTIGSTYNNITYNSKGLVISGENVNYIESSFTESTYYKITNPNQYISSITYNNVINALGYTPLSSSTGGGTSSGITSINNQTNNIQTLVTGNTGIDFNINSVGGTHTFNIPTASSSTTRGLLSGNDFNTFNNKQNIFSSQTKNQSFLSPESINGIPSFRDIRRRDLKNTLTTIGTVASDDYSVDFLATRYTQVGSSIWSVSGGKLNIAGGSTKTLSNYIGYSYYGKINSKKETISIDITVGVISSTTFGVGLGIQGASLAIQGAILLDSTNLGRLAFYFNNSTATEDISDGSLSLSAGDVINLRYTLLQNTLILVATNTTLSTRPSITYTKELINNNSTTYRTPNAGFATIYSLGGSHSVDNFTVVNNASKYPKVLFIDDSKGAGSHQSNEGQSYTSFLARKINGQVEYLSGGGNFISDANATEALLYESDYIFIATGTNDVLRGDSAATIMVSYNALESGLTGYTRGVNLFYVNLPPNNTVSTVTLNSSMATAFGDNVCKIYATFVTSGSTTIQTKFTNDGTHLNAEGKRIQANIIYEYGLRKGLWQTGENPNMGGNEIHSNGAFTALGGMNHIPQYASHIYTYNKGSQFGISPTYNGNDGLGMWSTSSGHAVLAAGCNTFDGSSITNTHTSPMRISLLNGDYGFSSDSGVTINATLSPTNRLTFTNSTKVWNTINGYHLFSGDNTSGSNSTIFRQIDGGSDSKALVMFENGSTISAGATSSGIGSGGGFHGYIGNSTRKILGSALTFGVISSTTGSEAGFLSLSSKPSSGALAERMRCDDKGNVVINTGGLTTTATDGFLYIPQCSGIPTGVPSTYTGRSPIIHDITNNRLYLYAGGSWKFTLLT